MIDTDKKEFKRMMNALMAIYYKQELSGDALRIWWGKLEKYEFSVVCKAFDKFSDISVKAPEPSDIIALCQHKVTIFAAIPSPLAQAENKRHSNEVLKFVANGLTKTKDMKEWARKIISSPKSYPDISIRYAKEALDAKS